MARYIDADKFIERIKASPAFPNMGMDGYFLRDVVINLLDNMPSADVAPKSKVEQLITLNSQLEAKVWEERKEKSEVAMEIFEEIERETKNHGITYAQRKIAELKKKYTEGKT